MVETNTFASKKINRLVFSSNLPKHTKNSSESKWVTVTTNNCNSEPLSNNHDLQININHETRNKTIQWNNIKITPWVEGDRSDCQPKANSIARSRRLRAMVVVEG